jgi:Amt family ammonium transporter
MESLSNSDLVNLIQSFFLLACGMISLLMIAGFAMYESGLVRAHNATASCFKILAIFALGGISYTLVGYNLMHIDALNGFWVRLDLGAIPSFSNTLANLCAAGAVAAIVSGVLAERVKIMPVLIVAVIFCGLMYPLQGAWIWGAGWLVQKIQVQDFSGASLHIMGGCFALTGALILGPRLGKFAPDGRSRALPGSNIPIATLGALLICVGWIGFMASKALPLNTLNNSARLDTIVLSAALASFAGFGGAALFAKLRYGKPDVTIALNGLIAGLVSISAAANFADPMHALLIGAVGGIVCGLGVGLFDQLKIDDVTGGLSVHLLGGIWGMLAVALDVKHGDFIAQIIGIAVIAGFSLTTSSLIWLALKKICGLRLAEKDEAIGSDRSEIGIKAYPDFATNSTE